MKYLIGIPYVNNLPLMKRAIASLGQEDRKNILIVANCNTNELNGVACGMIYWPVEPLSASQSLNVLAYFARARKADVLVSMHSDAEAVDGALAKLLSAAEKAEGKWGVLFTHYDALAAFNVKALEDVGPWDTILPQYFTDNDMYRRMRLRGWECRATDIYVKHEGSATINSDPKLKFLNRVTFDLYKQYYASKWNGLDDEPEKQWSKPWNGELEGL